MDNTEMTKIQKLLEISGLSCDDLLNKLQTFKSKETATIPNGESETDQVRNDPPPTTPKENARVLRDLHELEFIKQLRKRSLKTIKKYKLMRQKKKKVEKCEEIEVDCEEDKSPPEVSPIKNEDVRTKLKEQLELLRTNKKQTNLFCSSIPRTEWPRTDKRRREEKITETPSQIDKKLKTSNEVISNESELVIVNVIGGYQSPEHETPTIDEFEEPAIKLTKTKDFTKIKGWKNKKFLPIDNCIKGPQLDGNVVVTNEPIPDTSTSNKVYLLPSSVFGIPKEPIAFVDDKIVKSSAFVSSELDDFLNENMNLNISYEIPKLDAEESCNVKYEEIPIPQDDLLVPQKVREPIKPKYKAKTLAEKRRLMQVEKNKRIEETLKEIKQDWNHKEPKTDEDIRSFKRLCEDDIPFTKFRLELCEDAIDSYITYNGKRIRVTAASENENIAEIYPEKLRKRKSYDYVSVKSKTKDCKPSLLDDLKVDQIDAVKYHPGPLSKKKIAVNLTSSQNWETVIKKLPKIRLEVTPEVGKQFHPQIEAFLQDDGICLSEERVKMALSVLKVKKSNKSSQKCSFSFPLSYQHGQNQIVLRKKQEKQISVEKIKEGDYEIKMAVEDVVENLLNYIENQELSNIVSRNPEPEVIDEPMKIEEKIEENKGTKRKKYVFNRTKNEMKRLNCKVVSIAIDTEEKQLKCNKDYCRLGCICKSLECIPTNLITQHCGNHECMFNCTCDWKNPNQQITLPIGTNLFSVGTINHIQNEAKKDLAKEEKDFTQTVIEANNQLIVVENLTERKRRTTKVPSRYDSYYREREPNQLPIKTEKKIQSQIQLPSCSISLPRYDFSSLIPYCMVHNLYKCHCNCTATLNLQIYESQTISPSISIHSSPDVRIIRVKKLRRNSFVQETSFFDKTDFCSRTRGITTSYYTVRNKTLVHQRKLISTTNKLQKDLTFFLREKVLEERKKSRETKLTDASTLIKELPKNNLDWKLELQQKQMQTPQVKDYAKSETKNKAPESLQNECLNLLGDKASQVRLLPWKTLTTCYSNQTLQVWYSTVGPPRILLTENGKKPGNYYCNVRQLDNAKTPVTIDVIRWLSNNTVPEGKQVNNIFVILKFKHLHWEICGVCEKNIQEQSEMTKDKDLYVSLMRNSLENPEEELEEEEETKSLVRRKRLRFPKLSFNRTSFDCVRLEGQEMIPPHLPKIIFAPLPHNLMQTRWRIIEFNESFQHITFLKNGFTIRRKDINTAINLSQTRRSTIYLKSFNIKKHYDDPCYGIFCITNITDKFFVGPYHPKCDHNLEIVSLIKGVEKTHTQGFWFLQCEEKKVAKIRAKPERVIDLTVGSDGEGESKSKKAQQVIDVLLLMTTNSNKDQLKNLTNSKFGHHFMVPTVQDSITKKMSSEDVDNIRFIVTNVPGFGYIPAYQEGDGQLYVKCPLHKRMRTFTDHSEVISTYEMELRCWFVMAPLQFRIKVSIVNDIEDPSNIKPVDRNIVTGYNIVGKFGVLETSLNNRKALHKHGLSDEQIALVLLYRGRKAAQYATSAILQTVIAPMRFQQQDINRNFEYALLLLKEQVDTMQKQEKELCNLKENLHRKKLKSVVKVTKLMRKLPKKQYNKIREKLHKIIRYKGKRLVEPNLSDCKVYDRLPLMVKNDQISIQPLTENDKSSPTSYSGVGGLDELEITVLHGDEREPTQIDPVKFLELLPNNDDKTNEDKTTDTVKKDKTETTIDKFIPEVILDEFADNLKLNSTEISKKSLKELLHPKASTSEMLDVMLDDSSLLSSTFTSKLAEKALNNLAISSRKISPGRTTSTTTTTTSLIKSTPTSTITIKPTPYYVSLLVTSSTTSTTTTTTTKQIAKMPIMKTTPVLTKIAGNSISEFTPITLKPTVKGKPPENVKTIKKGVLIAAPSSNSPGKTVFLTKPAISNGTIVKTLPPPLAYKNKKIINILPTTKNGKEESSPGKTFKPVSISLPKTAVPIVKPGFIAVSYKDGTTKYIPYTQRLSFAPSLLKNTKKNT